MYQINNNFVKKGGLVLGIIVLFICSGFFTIQATNEYLPDLKVDFIAPNTAVEGDNITFNVTVENIGGGDVPEATAIEVGLFIDNEYNPISTNVTYGLSSGTFKYVNLYWIAEVGEHFLRVIVDYNNQIIESNELNNEKLKFIDVFSGPLLVIDINPDTLNLNSIGKWITCYIELPDEYDVVDINIGTILLNDVVSAEVHPASINDYDNDGILGLMVKFDRQEAIKILEPGETVAITVTGRLIDGMLFEGIDYIRVTYKPSPLDYPPICNWIESKGGPTGLTVPDICELTDAFLFDMPLHPYNFIPTSLEIYGVINYYLGEITQGNTDTGCSYC